MRHLTDEPTFTTGEIGKICEISAHTVKKRIDSGHLKGFRIPGSGDRRVERPDLVAWMSEAGIPIARLEHFERCWRIRMRGILTLLYTTDELLLSAFRVAAKTCSRKFRVEEVESEMALALKLLALKPEIVLIDFAERVAQATALCEKLRDLRQGFRVQLYGLLSDENADEIETVEFVPRGVEPKGFVEKISFAVVRD